MYHRFTQLYLVYKAKFCLWLVKAKNKLWSTFDIYQENIKQVTMQNW